MTTSGFIVTATAAVEELEALNSDKKSSVDLSDESCAFGSGGRGKALLPLLPLHGGGLLIEISLTCSSERSSARPILESMHPHHEE